MPEKIKRLATARVIRWDGLGGFDFGIDYGDGKHDAFPVGTQAAAEAEAERIRSGGSARTRDEIDRLLKG